MLQKLHKAIYMLCVTAGMYTLLVISGVAALGFAGISTVVVIILAIWPMSIMAWNVTRSTVKKLASNVQFGGKE